MTNTKGVHNAYAMGKEAYHSGQEQSSIPVDDLSSLEQEIWQKGYLDAGQEDTPAEGPESYFDIDPDEGMAIVDDEDNYKELDFN